MKAIGFSRNLPVDHPDALLEFEAPVPQPQGRDLLVQVKAVSVNPVDTKVRRGGQVTGEQPRVLGWDAVGIVVKTGTDVSRFNVGDRVWYAGALQRSGSNAEYQLVDERIVGHAPESLSDAKAAALPLATITAWELLFDRLQVSRDTNARGSLLVTGGAGGVGSILIQIARQLTGLTVITTASREETRNWVSELGASHVIDHTKPLAAQMKAIVPDGVTYIASLTATDQHFAQLVEGVAPQGRIGVIDDPGAIDVRALKGKSVALCWESMFTRSTFDTADVAQQGALLDEVAQLVDRGVLRTTLVHHFGQITPANLLRAHAFLESGRAHGKIVLEGFAR